MKQIGSSLLVAVFIATSLTVVDVRPADAVTCSSVCNQIRRACLNLSKAIRKVSRLECDEGRDTCRSGCADQTAICPGDCVTNCAGDLTCEAACWDGCANCCNSARESCLADAELVRQDAKLTCENTREGCRGDCIDPQPECVRDCTSGARKCKADMKLVEHGCKRDCKTSDVSRRACMRTCRKNYNINLQSCASTEAFCLGDCAGLNP